MSSPETLIKGRVMTREEGLAVAQRLFAILAKQSWGFASPGILIEHTARSVIKVTNDRVISSHDGDEVSIHFDSEGGSAVPLSVGTNQLDDAMLQQVIERVTSFSPKRKGLVGASAVDKDDPEQEIYRPRTYDPVSLWHDTTANAMSTVRGDTAPIIIEQIRKSNMLGVATVGLSARAACYVYRGGMTAWCRETDSEVTITARTLDGKASGWSGSACRDWSQIRPETLVPVAVDLAERGQNTMALEPGRRTAILSPTAVGQLIAAMATLFDAYATDVYQATPFAMVGSNGRKNKLGMRVIDPRLTWTSNPADEAGGFPPFFEAGSMTGLPGIPLTSTTWIEQGVLRNLAYNRSYAFQRGKIAREYPYSARLEAIPGTALHTVDEMIADCKNGIFVNRFSNVSVVDGQSGLMTGVTRDGCFHVKDGKIAKSVKNFRFLESPIFIFNKVMAVGRPVRVAFGYAPPANRPWSVLGSWPPNGRDSRWPLAPVIVPPMMLNDFNFSALSDAV